MAPVLAAASGWSGATAISPVGQPDPTRGSQLNDVAVNASGQALAAWDQYRYDIGGGATIGVAVQTGGRWGSPLTISDNTGFSMGPKVAVGTDGTMAVSWTYQDAATATNPLQKIQVAVMRPGGPQNWTRYELASAPVGGVAITPPVPVAIDKDGNVTAAWTLWDGARHVVQAGTLRKNSSSWDKTVLSGSTDDGLYLSLAVNADGDAAVAYSLSPYTGYVSGTGVEYVYRSRSSSAWSAPVRISETMPSSQGYITGPQVALDAAGLATVVYMGYGLEATRQDSSGVWTSPASIIESIVLGASYLSPDLAVDARGNAVVAVSIFDPTPGVDRASVWVSRGSLDRTWSQAERLTDPTVPVDAYATQVAISPNGNLALVGWIDHYHGVAQVSKLTGNLWGKATTIGKSTAFSSFQEVLALDAGSDTDPLKTQAQARAIWKSAKSGTQIYASGYSQ
ncbi:hypothetical protein [Methylomicrobium lacus]|uniref:hypothetical protein n=1 Tax=Methylomicrobium lacus TaxID=136992 RepID=UPI0035A98419